MGLIEPRDMPRIPPAKVPESFYLVTRQPAPLAGMEYPRGREFSWKTLSQLGLTHVACLTDDECPYDPSPLRALPGSRLQDLDGGVSPDSPIQEAMKVRRITLAVLAHLRAGEGVVVHCDGGTGRTGTVLGCALRGLGYSAEEVLAYLDRVTKARGRAGWPESTWQAEVVRAFEP